MTITFKTEVSRRCWKCGWPVVCQRFCDSRNCRYKNVVVVDSPTGRLQAVRRGRTGGLRPGRVLFEQGLSPFEVVERQHPWRRSLWILKAAGRPCGEKTERTKIDEEDGDKAEDNDHETKEETKEDKRAGRQTGKGGGRGNYGSGDVPSRRVSPWTLLSYEGGFHSRWPQRRGEEGEVFYFFPLSIGAGAPIWGSHSRVGEQYCYTHWYVA